MNRLSRFLSKIVISAQSIFQNQRMRVESKQEEKSQQFNTHTEKRERNKKNKNKCKNCVAVTTETNPLKEIFSEES